MSTKVEVLWYLEDHESQAFTAKDLLTVILSGEPRIRKALNELADEGMIEKHQGEEMMYYGFVGVSCEYRLRCSEFKESDQCLKHSFRCKTRQEKEDKEIDEDDGTE
jgi:Fe2+ or Zn2+ uptake regulation protein